jgi:hypothetical protein
VDRFMVAGRDRPNRFPSLSFHAALYSLTRDELRYILDPADVYGSDFPGETFRVLKERELRLYGENRTRRLVLEAWDRLGLVPRNRDGRYSTETVTTGESRPPTNPSIAADPLVEYSAQDTLPGLGMATQARFGQTRRPS